VGLLARLAQTLSLGHDPLPGWRSSAHDCQHGYDAAWADDMLTIYRDEAGSVRESASLELPSEVIWIDLLDPTDEEKAFVESRTHIQVPTVEALSEIEASSRLYVNRGVIISAHPSWPAATHPKPSCRRSGSFCRPPFW
jgi:hypothetical protein